MSDLNAPFCEGRLGRCRRCSSPTTVVVPVVSGFSAIGMTADEERARPRRAITPSPRTPSRAACAAEALCCPRPRSAFPGSPPYEAVRVLSSCALPGSLPPSQTPVHGLASEADAAAGSAADAHGAARTRLHAGVEPLRTVREFSRKSRVAAPVDVSKACPDTELRGRVRVTHTESPALEIGEWELPEQPGQPRVGAVDAPAGVEAHATVGLTVHAVPTQEEPEAARTSRSASRCPELCDAPRRARGCRRAAAPSGIVPARSWNVVPHWPVFTRGRGEVEKCVAGPVGIVVAWWARQSCVVGAAVSSS